MTTRKSNNQHLIEILQRLTKVETNVDNIQDIIKLMCANHKDLQDDFKNFEERVMGKIDNIQACSTRETVSNKYKLSIIVALITSVGLVITELVSVLPAL